MKEIKTKDTTEEEWLEREIDYFIQRLYIANQIAFLYNYGEKLEIPDTEIQDGTPLNNLEMIETLGSIEYNLYTNNGRSFISSEDKKKLDKIKELAMRQIIEDLKSRQVTA